MYMYRGSCYIKWPFILKCCCLLCSLSPPSQPCGCTLAICERLLVILFQKFTDLLEFCELPLVPDPSSWSQALPAPAFLRRKEGKPSGNEGRGRLWNDSDSCRLLRRAF